jgi:hypothetical protein
MTSRAQKFNKVLHAKQADLSADILQLKAEISRCEALNAKPLISTVPVRDYDYEESRLYEALSELEKQESVARYDKLALIDRENAIYIAESERVAQVIERWKSQNQDRRCHLKLKRDGLATRSEALAIELSDARAQLSEMSARKRCARLSLINNLIVQHRNIKKDKAAYFLAQENYAELVKRQAMCQDWIAGYETRRYHINNDYYTWKSEYDARDCLDLTRVAELDTDPRRDYQARYMLLDQELNENRAQLKKIGRVLAKLSAKASHDAGVPPKLTKPRYEEFDDLASEEQELKTLISELSSQLTGLKADIEMLDAELANPSVIPDDISHAQTRADERYNIMQERAASKLAIELARIADCRMKINNELAEVKESRQLQTIEPVSEQQTNLAALYEKLALLQSRLAKPSLID